MIASLQTTKIVSALIRGNFATHALNNSGWTVHNGKQDLHFSVADANWLISEGVLELNNGTLRTRREAKSWLRRTRLSISSENKPLTVTNVPKVNVNESPLSRLALQNENGCSFLAPELVTAGDRFRKIFDRSQMQPRITMSYDAMCAVDKSAPTSGNPLGDMGHDARNQMNCLLTRMPKDAASAVLNVCGFQKGLQQLELEKKWPRRSAKMILRLGLEILATEMGIAPATLKQPSSDIKVWRTQNAVPTVLG